MKNFFLISLCLYSFSSYACRCAGIPDNKKLFEKASVLVKAEFVQMIDAETSEVKIIKVYKGEQKLLGTKTQLKGVMVGTSCQGFPPKNKGETIVLEGPEPYRYSAACSFVWNPEE